MTAASAAASVSAVPMSSTSGIWRMASVNRSVSTLESSTSKTLSPFTLVILSRWFEDIQTHASAALGAKVGQAADLYVGYFPRRRSYWMRPLRRA